MTLKLIKNDNLIEREDQIKAMRAAVEAGYLDLVEYIEFVETLPKPVNLKLVINDRNSNS